MKNDTSKIINLLQDSGFSLLEAKVYITGLINGPTTMSKLAKSVGISRQTGYEIVRRLENIELAITSKKEYGQKVYMSSLDKVERFIERKNRKLEITKSEIRKSANQFNFSRAELPKVRFFENINELKKAWYETLNSKNKKVYNIMPISDMTEMFGEDFSRKYIGERMSRGIESYSIRVDNPSNDKREHMKELRYVRYLPPNLYDISSLFCIFDEKVLIVTSRTEEVGLIVESKEISRSLMNIWKILWEKSIVIK